MQRIISSEMQIHETEHAKIVRDNAAECTLFLKRNGDFPVQPCRVNLYGSGARRTVKGGKGSGDVNVRHAVSVEEGLKNAGFTVMTEEWLAEYDKLAEKSRSAFYRTLQAQTAPIISSLAGFMMARSSPA